MLNSSIAEGGKEMIFHSNHNIGVAMDTPKGLIVPVIHQVPLKSILDIAVELGELQVRKNNTSLFYPAYFRGCHALSTLLFLLLWFVGSTHILMLLF